uniref:NADH-ubiquinone oxidoreductase chain 6 n=1 Tax=Pseudo-nitzschia delicatissima TaxID=44447 RepID=A0A8B6QN01_9STRA|nr:NADH dehydrogenase subunit 6 [Pseudo-nitzschia delicatissima]QTJ30094.1 NADH dehydrogenase subunit 6 [Pseudo-nitzschia delicatissima]
MIYLTYIMCALLLGSASMVIITRNPLYSVLFLVASFLSASMLLFLFENEFLALFFLVIYLGAIAILFLFVVMMLDIKYRELQMSKFYFPIGMLIGVTMLIEVYGAFSKVFSKDTNFSFQDHNSYLNWYENLDSLPDVYVFGQVFYTQYVLQILIAGLILYLAAIAVAFLTVKTAFNRVNLREQSISKQLSRKNVL